MHYYQPIWTLVGAGVKSVASSGRPTASVIPPGIKWVKSNVREIDPDTNTVRTDNGMEVGRAVFLLSLSLIWFKTCWLTWSNVIIGLGIDVSKAKGQSSVVIIYFFPPFLATSNAIEILLIWNGSWYATNQMSMKSISALLVLSKEVGVQSFSTLLLTETCCLPCNRSPTSIW